MSNSLIKHSKHCSITILRVIINIQIATDRDRHRTVTVPVSNVGQGRSGLEPRVADPDPYLKKYLDPEQNFENAWSEQS